ncbi:MAG: hypothetical protein A2V66_12950 [Ignavibacteria bacterium RBG_13_36_8]|nr:MAG: hypothetical protein A2V66_12950 [Ignavibacteria bacterium RBG_13_36_8]
MKLFRYFIFFYILLQSHLAAKDDFIDSKFRNHFIIDSIKIKGNEITEDFVILRELTFTVGDSVNLDILSYNQERLYSLRIFSYVKVFSALESNKTIIYIEVKEGWYIYPFPFLRLNHSSLKFASYGVYLRWKNFRGRNESIRATAAFGYDPYYRIDYYNPYLIEDEDIFFAFHSAYQKYQNKSQRLLSYYNGDFDYTIFSNFFTIGKRLDRFNYLKLFLGYNYVKANVEPVSGVTASNTRIDRTSFLTLAYTYDTRDLIQFPQRGFYGEAAFAHKGFGLNNINYNILLFDLRNYWNFYDDFVARERITYRHIAGSAIPYYDYSYFGYDEIVRGHSRDVREGHNYLLTSVELSYPIFKEWNVSVDLPIIPERITSARIGMYLYLFADTGITFMNNENITTRGFYSGYGVGINMILLPYSGIKFEYAFDENMNGEFIIGTDFSL